MARCKRCNTFMLTSSSTGYCKKCNAAVLQEMMDKEAQEKANEQRRIAEQKKADEQRRIAEQKKATEIQYQKDNTNPVTKSMYPYIKEMKGIFEGFFSIYKYGLPRNDDAWQDVSDDNPLLAGQALEYKRTGKFVEALSLYTGTILDIGAITEGWAKGLFKTLACAGDFADAITFGRAWNIRVDPRIGYENDQIIIQTTNLVIFLLHPEKREQFMQYLISISGNPNYTIDLERTDINSEEVKQALKDFESL